MFTYGRKIFMTKIFSIPFGNLWGLRLVGEERERENPENALCVFPEILFLRRFVVLVLSPTTWMGADRVS